MDETELGRARILRDFDRLIEGAETDVEREAIAKGLELGLRIGQQLMHENANRINQSIANLEELARITREVFHGGSSSVSSDGETSH
jgi:flagellar biosynthesis/type III secretory pathway protein FliH